MRNLFILPLLALAACGSADDRNDVEAPTSEAASGAPEDVPEAGPAEAAQAPLTAIPENYRGVWDIPSSNGDPASDLRLDIRANEIEFYESLGKVTAIERDGDGIVVDLAMSGEGETWTVRNRLVLTDDGEALTIHEAGKEPGTYSVRRRIAE